MSNEQTIETLEGIILAAQRRLEDCRIAIATLRADNLQLRRENRELQSQADMLQQSLYEAQKDLNSLYDHP